MNRSLRLFWIAAALLLVLLAVLIRQGKSRKPKEGIQSTARPPDSIQTNPPISEASGTATDPFANALKKLSEKRQAEVLVALKQSLSSLPADERLRLLRRFLDSGVDAPTSAEFKVGPNGFLQSAPTLRCWALDYLAEADPAAAA